MRAPSAARRGARAACSKDGRVTWRRVVAEAGRTEQRQRLLPARVVVYYVLGLALFSQCSYEEVMRVLVEGLAWADGWASAWNVPTKAALFKARARLGPEPIEALYRQSAVVLATKKTKGAWYRGWRLNAEDEFSERRVEDDRNR